MSRGRDTTSTSGSKKCIQHSRHFCGLFQTTRLLLNPVVRVDNGCKISHREWMWKPCRLFIFYQRWSRQVIELWELLLLLLLGDYIWGNDLKGRPKVKVSQLLVWSWVVTLLPIQIYLQGGILCFLIKGILFIFKNLVNAAGLWIKSVLVPLLDRTLQQLWHT